MITCPLFHLSRTTNSEQPRTDNGNDWPCLGLLYLRKDVINLNTTPPHPSPVQHISYPCASDCYTIRYISTLSREAHTIIITIQPPSRPKDISGNNIWHSHPTNLRRFPRAPINRLLIFSIVILFQ